MNSHDVEDKQLSKSLIHGSQGPCLPRRNSKNFPIKATYNFTSRSGNDYCFFDISNTSHSAKVGSPMFFIGNHSPIPPNEADAVSVINGRSPFDTVESKFGMRRTWSVDALHTRRSLRDREHRSSKVSF